MKLMRELRYIFPRRQRLLFLCLFFMQLVQTAMDFLSVSLILPFVNILVTPDRLDGQWWYELLRRLTHSGSHESIMLLLTFALMAVYVLKNLYKLLMIQLSVKFVSYNEVRMCAKMIRCYMNKPYTFHLQRNTSEIVRNITQDVGGAFSVISTIFNLISDSLIILVLVVYLFAVDTTMTLAISAALLLCSAVYFLVVRKKIRATGTEARKLNAKKYKAIHQAMGGIKEVKVMGREEFFADVYQDAGAKAVVLNKRYKIIASLPGILIESLCICSVLGVVALRIASHQALADIVPSLSAFAVAAMRLMPRANSINGDINTITYNLPSLEALYADLTDSEREQRERQAHLRLHAELLHKLATGKQVEELIGAAELDVSFDNDGVISLHDRVHELVKADWQVRGVAIMEIVALENAGDRELRHELQELFHVQRQNPFGVVAKRRLLGVEDLECLVDVGFRVRLDLLAGKLRAGRVAPRRIADERRAVTDDERDLVAEVLELAQLAQRDGVADMDVRSRRVDAELDVEGFAALELFKQSAFRHNLRRARGDDVKLFFRCEHRNVLHTTDLHKRF